jgi:hypothetical protein
MITFRINTASSHVEKHGFRRCGLPLMVGTLLVASGALFAAVPAPERSCEEIRADIGVLQPANPELLRSIALRKDCGFTSAEVYKAAYGDRPLPPQEGRAEYLRHYRHLGDAHVEDD